jgi:serine/threonine-protein kinase
MAARLGDVLRFGRYEALVRLGAGGMAEVFAARLRGEAGFDKLVAVKRMLPHLVDDHDFAERFFDEAKIAAALSSPHIVSTFDLGRTEEGAPFIVLDLVVGVTLKAAIAYETARPGSVGRALLLEWIAQAADGLEDAHRAAAPDGTPLRVVHRDVSPTNILVGADGRARICDFGVAHAILRSSRTATGALLGKFGYMAPEYVSDSRAVDHRADVFGLGIVLWEALTQQRLFAATSPEEMRKRLIDPVPPPSRFDPSIDRALDEATLRALARDPDARWQSAGALASAIRDRAGRAPPARDAAAVVARIGGAALADVRARIAAALDGRPGTGTHSVHGLDGSANVSGEPTDERDVHALPTAILDTEVVRPSAGRARGAVLWIGSALLVLGALLLGWWSATAFRAPEPAPPITRTETRTEPVAPARAREPDVGGAPATMESPIVDPPEVERRPVAPMRDERPSMRVRPGELVGIDRFPGGSD